MTRRSCGPTSLLAAVLASACGPASVGAPSDATIDGAFSDATSSDFDAGHVDGSRPLQDVGEAGDLDVGQWDGGQWSGPNDAGASLPRDAADTDSAPSDVERWAALETLRATNFRTRIHQGTHLATTVEGATGWELFFDGTDTPADPGPLGLPSALAWDVPVDDDYVLGGSLVGVRPNTPSPGFYTVDRVNDRQKRGYITRRLEHVTLATGITIEARLRVDASSEARAIWVEHVFTEGNFTLFVSPDEVGLGAASTEPTPLVSMAVDATQFHTYRLVRMPNERRVMLFVDPVATDNRPSLSLEAAPSLPASEPGEPPLVLIGDNLQPSGPGDPAEGFMVLDYAAISAGGFLPGAPIRAAGLRSTPWPEPETATSRFSAPGRYTCDVVPAWSAIPPPGVPTLRGSASGVTAGPALTPPRDGVIRIDTAVANFQIDDSPIFDSVGDWTIEFCLQILPETDLYGVGASFIDGIGAAAILWSRDRVSLMMGTKAAGIRSHMMDTTNAFHAYRLVHRAGEFVVHLYVDGDPVPVLFDYRLEATQFRPVAGTETRLVFGIDDPTPHRAGRVLLDSILWQRAALAPSWSPF